MRRNYDRIGKRDPETLLVTKRCGYWVSYALVWLIATGGLVTGIIGILHPKSTGGGLPTAGVGISVNGSQVSHLLTQQTLLPFGDPYGPQVSYVHAFGQMNPAVVNDWRMGPADGFDPGLVPGVVPGDDGQGNLGMNWTVPTIGEYTFYVDCDIIPSEYVEIEHQSFSMAFNLGATTVDPNDSGFIPAGGISSIDLTSGTSSMPLTPLRISASGSVHAGCDGCPVDVGARLSVHMIQNWMSEIPSPTFETTCNIQVVRSK